MISETKLNSVIRNAINEVVNGSNTIRLQLINGYFYPVDHISNSILADELRLGRIPEDRMDRLYATLVSRGYKLALADYVPEKGYDTPRRRIGEPIGGEPKPQKNPCTKCNFNGLCDSDGCGKHHFKLFEK